MAQNIEEFRNSIPVGDLGIIPLQSCSELGNMVNEYIVDWRKERESVLHQDDKIKDSYIVNTKCSRFGSGEAKGTILDSIRGKDLYLLVDVTNYSIEYSLCGHMNKMSPDDHYSDLKRIITAAAGKARRINVIMPFLYESRQHKRTARESLDCAVALQELHALGVENIITFDAHDPRVQNAIPNSGFDSIQPTYQFIKSLFNNVPDLQVDSDHMMIISPDEGAMGRAVYYSNVLGLDMGMFYKRRDYSRVVNGRNPIVAHEFLGSSVEGKDVFIVDDMISSGESMLDVAKELKQRKAKRVFVAATFGLFTNGLKQFDEYYEQGLISKVLTTNVIYQTPDLLSRPYYINVDLSKYIALLIDKLNYDHSISELLDPNAKIQNALTYYRKYHK
ncbi:MAG: ribose-phosphate pyrophosphokinase [Coprococcus catus]|jgi:ribose-phosphate pyrophosphokinase|uniref:ribose-phosphate diphosphokinase n=1 Tax=Coprococcus intestinihominis TaxID=3133154 RepID=A0ABV1B1L6_9FIRM|nr:ribose-phosphate pyrophosphokinase [Coprococcus catus]MDD6344564.1 ribose-phosphate pyrophosphokinase [Coprococcus catus]MDY5988696.1 ribose-phosphate pyrophosphokinase [Coprococcus catus]